MPRPYGTTGFQALTSAPAVGPAGSTYYDSGTSRCYYSDGTRWLGFDMAVPALPDPAATALSTTQVYGSTSETELPTPVRASLTNPSSLKRMLVRVETTGTFEQTASIGGAQQMLSSILVPVGTPTVIGVNFWRHSVAGNDATVSVSSYAWGLYWLAAGTSATWGVSVWKTNASATCQTRLQQIIATALRYDS
jgi:hypothetical protein